jgi:hypothetical protein
LPGLPEKLNYDLDICLCDDREAGTRLTPETGRKGAARRKNTGRKDKEEMMYKKLGKERG